MYPVPHICVKFERAEGAEEKQLRLKVSTRITLPSAQDNRPSDLCQGFKYIENWSCCYPCHMSFTSIKLTLRHCFHRELKSSTFRTILSITMDHSRILMFNLPER